MNEKAAFTVPDQADRVALVSGANTGLGFEACRVLAGRGARVIMACRSIAKGENARNLILEKVPGAQLELEELDVSSMDSVRRCAERLESRLERLDLLINNAGVMAIPAGKSADGYDLQFATNHLGHFLLTGLMLPRLLATPGSRIVPVSSIAARQGSIDFEDLMGDKHYDTWKAYNQSKLANLMFGFELQRRLERRGADTAAIVAHPGASMTDLFSTPGGGFIKRVLTPVIRPFLYQSAEAGAQIILYAATSPDALPGGYYGPANRNEMKGPPAAARIPAAAQDEEVARRLWRASEELVGLSYLDE